MISVIDIDSRTQIATITAPPSSYAIGFAPWPMTGYAGTGYAGCTEVFGVNRINTLTNTSTAFHPTSEPVSDVAVSPTGRFALTTGGTHILVIELPSGAEVGTVMCGEAPCEYVNTGGIVFNADGTRAYAVDDLGSNMLITIDTKRGSRTYLQELSRVPIPAELDESSWQIAIAGNYAYVVAYGAPGRVVKFDVSRAVPVAVAQGDTGNFGYELGMAVPTDSGDCRNWKNFGGGFKNHGDCVSFVNTKGKNKPRRR